VLISELCFPSITPFFTYAFTSQACKTAALCALRYFFLLGVSSSRTETLISWVEDLFQENMMMMTQNVSISTVLKSHHSLAHIAKLPSR
jgi:hypothetical protein